MKQSLQQSPLRENLQQAIEWLDPSEGDVTLAHIQQAYDLLLMYHPASEISFRQYILTNLVTEPTLVADWLDEQSDLYRTIIASSFLALQLMQRDEATFDILSTTLERALLVLRVLYNAPNDFILAQRLLESRYPLLNALFMEPLLPLSRQDRITMWKDTTEPISLEEIIIQQQEHMQLVMPTKQEILKEEQTLLHMAQQEIPKEFLGETKIFIFEPTHQGTVTDVPHGTKHRLKIYGYYGVLALSTNYSSQATIYCLEPTTTITYTTLDGILEIHVHIEPFLKFRVEHAKSAMEWMQAIQQGIDEAKVALKLKQELMEVTLV